MKRNTLNLNEELQLVEWGSDKIFFTLESFSNLQEGDLILALILCNYCELESSSFSNPTQKFLAAADIALAQLEYFKELNSSPNVFH